MKAKDTISSMPKNASVQAEIKQDALLAEVQAQPFVSGMTRKKVKKPRTIAQKRAIAGYLFILPFLIGFIMLLLPTLITSVAFAFCDIVTPSLGSSYTYLDFVGLKYIRAVFNDATYIQSLLSSLGTLAIQVITVLIFSFVLSNILNQKFKGRVIARIIFFLPVLTASTAIVLLNSSDVIYAVEMQDTMSINNESVNFYGAAFDIVQAFWLPSDLMDIIVDAVTGVSDMIQKSGVQILVFLSGLQTISPSLYESSKMEGATPWEDFWKITFPMISPLILVNTIYTVIDALSGLESPVMLHIYDMYIDQNDSNMASAESWLYFIIVFICVGLIAWLLSKFVYYENE